MASYEELNKKVQAKVDAANGGINGPANAMSGAAVNNQQSNIGTVFNTLNENQQQAAKNISGDYAAANLKSTQDYVKAVNDSYNEGIDMQKKTTAQQQAALNQQYQYNVDQNAVQAAINRRNIEKTLSAYGMQNSGQQAVQQTANEVAKQNANNAITQQKNAAYNSLAAQLDEYIANVNMQKAQNTASAYKSMADSNANANLNLSQSAMSNAANMAQTQYTTENQNEQNALDRAFTTSEREAQQKWQSGENQLDRDFTRSERLDTQKYNTSEREATQKYNTSEREATQKYNTSERLATQKYNTSERVAQQNWQSGENAKDRTVTLAKAAASSSGRGTTKSSGSGGASVSEYSKYSNYIKKAETTEEKLNYLSEAAYLGFSDADIQQLCKDNGIDIKLYQTYMSGANYDTIKNEIKNINAQSGQKWMSGDAGKKSWLQNALKVKRITAADYDYLMAYYGLS